MSEILHHGYPCPMSDEQITEALWKLGGYSPEGVAVQQTIGSLRLALGTATRERDDIAVCADGWMKRTVAAERERDEARQDAKRLMSLTQNWYEGRARIGAHMTFVDQRFYDSVRLQRTGWPGDDANGDGGPPEE